MNILVVGGNGGIGLAIVQHLVKRWPDAQIHATYRCHPPSYIAANLTWSSLNASVESQVVEISQRFTQLDWLINCAGFLHNKDQGPEKSLQAFDPDFFFQNISSNTLPTMLLAKHFTPLLKRSPAPKLVTVSARVGSISDNRLGGWYSYRASKAALNMLLKTLSIEWQRVVRHGTILALHPGTTDTPLSKPFQANVDPEKLFTSPRVANDLVNIIASACPDSSGHFLSYDGSIIPW